MVDKKIVLDWVKNDREIKKECQSILMDAYKFGVLEHSPDGISSVDVSKEMGKDEEVVVWWCHKEKTQEIEHLFVFPLSWLYDEKDKKKGLDEWKEENKKAIMKADPEYEQYVKLKKKFEKYGL